MATATRRLPDVVVLHRVPFNAYARLSDAPENRHLRMAYHDGTLEIMSPHLPEHEEPSRMLSIIVTAVAGHLGLSYHGAGGATFRRGGRGVFLGQGKEPDQSFYIANVLRLPKDRKIDLDAGHPPPDLWIEVDNRASSKGRLPIYAALGVPEVWRYRSRRKTLSFLRLVDSAYQPVDRSLALPILTPALVMEALALGDAPIESDWLRLLSEWVARTFGPPAGGA